MRIKQPSMEPYGDILTHDIQWASKPVEEWNHKVNMWVWAADMIDDTHYIEWINGEFMKLPAGSCRLCAKKIKPYKNKYYQKHYDNGVKYCFLYDAEHYYCEACAKKESAKDFFTENLPFEVNRFQTMRDGEYVETIIYSDGSRWEEMTSRERAREAPAW